MLDTVCTSNEEIRLFLARGFQLRKAFKDGWGNIEGAPYFERLAMRKMEDVVQ